MKHNDECESFSSEDFSVPRNFSPLGDYKSSPVLFLTGEATILVIQQRDGWRNELSTSPTSALHYAQGSPGELGYVRSEEAWESALLTNLQEMPRLLLAGHNLNNKICRNAVPFNFDVVSDSIQILKVGHCLDFTNGDCAPVL